MPKYFPEGIFSGILGIYPNSICLFSKGLPSEIHSDIQFFVVVFLYICHFISIATLFSELSRALYTVKTLKVIVHGKRCSQRYLNVMHKLFKI